MEGIEKKGVVINYPNGQVKEEGIIFNDTKVGRWTEYFDNGKRKNTGLYIAGKEHGKWYYWYKSGKKEKVGVYQNGIKDGLWRGWYFNGNQFFERNYKMVKKMESGLGGSIITR